jgi:hypothetical protein
MTKLVVEELKATLSQTVTLTEQKRFLIEAVRPYIYMHNAPAGTFTIKIRQSGNELASKDFTSSEIKSDLSTTDNYAHLWKVIRFDNPIQLDRDEYEIELSSTGYTFSNSSYIGWIKEHENRFNKTDGSELSSLYGPYSYQLMNYIEAR